MSLDACTLHANPKQMELRLHGTAEFPCEAYDTPIQSGKEGGVDWHWHEETELIYVAEGQVELFLPDAHWQLLQGEGAWIHANVLHSILSAKDSRIRSIVFHTNFISGGADTIFQKKYIAPLTAYSSFKGLHLTTEISWQAEMLQEIIAALADLESKPDGYEWRVREHLSHLWYGLYCNTQHIKENRSPKSMDVERLHNMLHLIENAYSTPLDLAQIAAAANIGERECLRCFQRTIGISPLQYLLRYRVSQAAILLRETTLPIAEIGMQCGFDSPSHFAQTFRKYFSITPSAYRKGRI